MRIVIYAIGQVFEKNKDDIIWENVVAICDEKTLNCKMINGAKVIKPKQLCKIEFDYIAVFSNGLFEDIMNSLVNDYDVKKEQIVSWKFFVKNLENNEYNIKMMLSVFQENSMRKVLDYGISVFPQFFYNKKEIKKYGINILDGIGEERYESYACLYNHIFQKIEKCNHEYDASCIWGWDDNTLRHVKLLLDKSKRIIIYDKDFCLELLKEKKKQLMMYGEVDMKMTSYGVMWIVNCGLKRKNNNFKIYVVTHKDYKLHEDNVYTPLCVGGYKNRAWKNEENGDNISKFNGKINECTALYWIWKNTNDEYVGLCHYRRYMYNKKENSDDYLDRDRVKEILEDYDLIMPKTEPLYGITVANQIRESIDKDAFDKGMEIMRKVIKKNQSSYVQAFEDVMAGHRFFAFNMFVTRRIIMDKYCQWLFSFLLEAAELMDVSVYDNYSKRVIGFFAERMWTVWLMHEQLNIYELPGTW